MASAVVRVLSRIVSTVMVPTDQRWGLSASPQSPRQALGPYKWAPRLLVGLCAPNWPRPLATCSKAFHQTTGLFYFAGVCVCGVLAKSVQIFFPHHAWRKNDSSPATRKVQTRPGGWGCRQCYTVCDGERCGARPVAHCVQCGGKKDLSTSKYSAPGTRTL